MSRTVLGAVLASAISVCLSSAGPIGDYYLTGCFNGNCTGTATMFRVHGNQVTSWTSHNQIGGEYGIAINQSKVKTISYYNYEPGPPHQYGAAYDFGGNYIDGSQYSFNILNDSGRIIMDGTSDGTTYNYAMENIYSELRRFGPDWGNGTLMWSLEGVYSTETFGGVSLDTAANRIWIAKTTAGSVFDPVVNTTVGNIQKRRLDTGAYVSSFTVNFNNGGLAVDDDGSLWMANNDNKGWIYHYSSLGVEIPGDRIQICSNCSTLWIYGGEIGRAAAVDAWMAQQSAVPEPATFWLAGVGGALLLLSRRK